MTGVADHRVVIVGAGFGGLFAAKFLRRAPVQVTLVDRRNYHLFQPLLYQLATGILSEGEVAPPIRDVLRRHANVSVEMATVTGFDLANRTVSAVRPDDTPRIYEYDSLIVGAGAAQSYFGHDEFARFASGMKTIDDALELRGRIFGSFEMAEMEEDPDVRRSWLTFVVVGGGATGVELAGQIAELSRSGLKGNFRGIDPTEARVVLVDGGQEILAAFGDRLSHKAAAELQRLGVTIRTGVVVTGVDAFGVDLTAHDGAQDRIACRTKIWAAGVSASPLAGLLAEASGATCDRSGRIGVLPDCTLPDHPEVFAIGDMMALDDLPGVAEVAMQSGIHAANTVKRRLRGKAGGDVHLSRPRQHGHDLAFPRRRELQGHPGLGFPGVVDVARRAHHLPDGVQEPPLCPLPLGGDLPGRRTGRADDHDPPGGRTPRHRRGGWRGVHPSRHRHTRTRE